MVASKHWYLDVTKRETSCGQPVYVKNPWDRGTWDTDELDCFPCAMSMVYRISGNNEPERVKKWEEIAERIKVEHYEGKMFKCENYYCGFPYEYMTNPYCPQCGSIGFPTNNCSYCKEPLSESGVCTAHTFG